MCNSLIMENVKHYRLWWPFNSDKHVQIDGFGCHVTSLLTLLRLKVLEISITYFSLLFLRFWFCVAIKFHQLTCTWLCVLLHLWSYLLQNSHWHWPSVTLSTFNTQVTKLCKSMRVHLKAYPKVNINTNAYYNMRQNINLYHVEEASSSLSGLVHIESLDI